MPYIGKSPGKLGVRQRYYYTATGSETSKSGADDNGLTLKFEDGEYVDVYLNGSLLVAGSDYNTSTANTISGLAALAANDVLEVIVYDIYSLAKTNSEAQRTKYYVTATGGETSISGTDDNGATITFSAGAQIDVRLNGVSLKQGDDYNTTTANTVGGLTALTAGQLVEIVVYEKFVLADMVKKSGDTMTGGLSAPSITSTGGVSGTTGTFSSDISAVNADLSGSLGIGTTSPAKPLTVDGGADYSVVLRSASSRSGLVMHTPGTGALGNPAASALLLTDNTFRLGTTNHYNIIMDQSGRVTMPAQPAFFAAGSGTTINNGADTKVSFGTEVFDIGSNYSTSTSRFTAPVGGVYLFKSVVRVPLAGSNMRFDMLFTVNGSGRAGEGINQQNTNDPSVSSSVIISLSANDYVEVWVNQNSGSNGSTSSSLNLAQGGTEHATHFCGYLLG